MICLSTRRNDWADGTDIWQATTRRLHFPRKYETPLLDVKFGMDTSISVRTQNELSTVRLGPIRSCLHAVTYRRYSIPEIIQIEMVGRLSRWEATKCAASLQPRRSIPTGEALVEEP